MVLKRIIPTLLLKSESLVKTIGFKKYNYIGDPINTVRVFNELEVDELCFLDISATNEGREPSYELLQGIAEECFMPLSYGGGINSFDQAKKILGMGFEKIIINSAAFANQNLILKITSQFGRQSVIGSIDVKHTIFKNYKGYDHSGKKNIGKDPVIWARELEKMGVGELLVTSIDKDGTWSGYDINLVEKIANSINIPLIVNGGCGSIKHIKQAFSNTSAQAAAVGSLVLYQKKGMGVLINFPEKEKLRGIN